MPLESPRLPRHDPGSEQGSYLVLLVSYQARAWAGLSLFQETKQSGAGAGCRTPEQSLEDNVGFAWPATLSALSSPCGVTRLAFHLASKQKECQDAFATGLQLPSLQPWCSERRDAEQQMLPKAHIPSTC